MAQVTVIGIMIGWATIRFGTTRSELGWRTDTWRADIRLGLIAALMLLPPILVLNAVLAQLVTYEHPTRQMTQGGAEGSQLTIVAAFVSTGLIRPVFEEVVLRGFLLSWLNRFFDKVSGWRQILLGGRHKDATTESAAAPLPSAASADQNSHLPALLNWRQLVPVTISAAIFALLHLGQGAAPIPLFLLGMGLGCLFQMTGRLLPCIIVHLLLNNWSVVTMTLDKIVGD